MYALGVIVVLYFYVRLGIWLAKKATANISSTPSKWLIRASVALVLFLIPFGDEIAGRIYFDHLCKTEAGAKVYQTIELPAEYWDKEGNPKFFNQYGFIDQKFWTSHIDEASKVVRIAPFLGIDRDDTDVSDKGTGITLGKIVTFRNWGGWMRRNLSANNTAQSCQFLHDKNFSNSFYSKLYRPEVTSGKE